MKNRIVKFRVWDKVEKTFWNTNDGLYFWLHGNTAKELGGTSIAYFIGRNEQFVVQQFTGLTDKDGKEIYEGDIIKSGYSTSTGEVEYYAPCFMVMRSRAAFVDTSVFMKNGKVVENIFENTELLKKHNETSPARK